MRRCRSVVLDRSLYRIVVAGRAAFLPVCVFFRNLLIGSFQFLEWETDDGRTPLLVVDWVGRVGWIICIV